MVATAPGTATSTAISTLPTRSSLTTSLVSMRALMLPRSGGAEEEPG